MDFTFSSAPAFRDKLPPAADVVIIGGGIIGISTAWYLNKRGKSVVICEKGRIACEQSSRNWGWLRVTGRDSDEIPIAIESLECWAEMDRETQTDLGFKARQGVAALIDNEEEMAGFTEWAELAKTYGLDTHMLSAAEINENFGSTAGDWKGGIITPSDARAEPFKAVPGIAKTLQGRGVTIRENCAVRTLEKKGGKLDGVMTEDGFIKAGAVVCAAGGWSSLFLSNSGVKFPQLVVQGTVARTEKAPEIHSGAFGLQDVFLRRRQDGGYTVATGLTTHIIGAGSFRNALTFRPSLASASEIGIKLGRDPTQKPLFGRKWTSDQTSPFETNRVLNPPPETKALKKMRARFDKRLPELAGLAFAQSWSGMIDATPDVVPVMDEISGVPGLFLASGFSGHGFGIGPGAGRVMADLVCGNAPGHDLDRFRFSRFSDGSNMRPGPAI